MGVGAAVGGSYGLGRAVTLMNCSGRLDRALFKIEEHSESLFLISRCGTRAWVTHANNDPIGTRGTGCSSCPCGDCRSLCHPYGPEVYGSMTGSGLGMVPPASNSIKTPTSRRTRHQRSTDIEDGTCESRNFYTNTPSNSPSYSTTSVVTGIPSSQAAHLTSDSVRSGSCQPNMK